MLYRSLTLKMDILSELPIEVVHEILKYLSAEDLARCCLVSKNWMALAKSDNLWKRHCIEHGYSVKLLQRTQDTQCEWYQRFLKEKNLTVNWTRGRFQAKTIKDRFTEVLFMNEGRILATVFPRGLKMYSTVDDKSTYELIMRNRTLISYNNRTIVLKGSDPVYYSYMIHDGFCFPKYSAKIVIKTNLNCRCVGVLDETICFVTGSKIRFHSAVTGKEIAVEEIDLEEAEFVCLEHGLYAYDQRRILEYDSLGKRMMTFECEGDIIPPVDLFSNESILLADSFSPKEEICLSSKVLVAWDRKSGKRVCRLSERVKALVLHPWLPVFYYVPKIVNSAFLIICYDASAKNFLWEMKVQLLLTTNITSHLCFVANNLLYCILNRYAPGSIRPYDPEHFLLDTITGEETQCKNRVEGFYELVWYNRERIAFVSNKTLRKPKLLKILSYESQ